MKGDRKLDGYNFRSRSRLKYDNATLQNAVLKAQTYLAEQKNDIELASMEEAHLVCEALKQIYLTVKYELCDQFTTLVKRINGLEDAYERLKVFGDELENEDELHEEIENRHDIEDNEPKADNPFEGKISSHNGYSTREFKSKLTNESFSLIKPKSSKHTLDQMQSLKEPVRPAKQDNQLKQGATINTSPESPISKPILSGFTAINKNLSPLKPVVSQLKAQDLQKYFHGQAKLADLSPKDYEKALEMDPRFMKSMNVKPINEPDKTRINESPINPTIFKWNPPANTRLKLDYLRNDLLKPSNK